VRRRRAWLSRSRRTMRFWGDTPQVQTEPMSRLPQYKSTTELMYPSSYRLNFSMNQSGTDSTALLRVSCSGRRAGSVDHARAHGGGGQQSGRTHVRATVQVPPLTIMKPLLNCKTLLKSLFHCKECVCATQGGGGCGACPAEPRGPTAAPAQPLRGGAGEALPLPVT
jgi:hypothetical protein